MARLASQIKGGYYAADPLAVAAVLRRLRPPTQGECLILDPCAGEGHALLQLASSLKGIPYGIELSEDRADIVRQSIPEGQALVPADFLRCSISYGSFSFVWCNPPYDYATGGEGRVEDQFLRHAVNLVAPGGVLALVCPEDVAEGYGNRRLFHEWFDDVSAMPFPKQVRHFKETVVLGRKRRQPKASSRDSYYAWNNCDGSLETWLEERVVYTLPPGQRPRQFRIVEPTDNELIKLVTQSPIRFHLDRAVDKSTACGRPPISPGIGHRAMLLASGHIDGLISPENEPPHVIRGTATKDKYVSSCEESEDAEGNTTTRTTFSERPRLVIRVLDSQGNISTLE
jgi:SAM-dependent methyltransferase